MNLWHFQSINDNNISALIECSKEIKVNHKQLITECKENHFYSLPFGQAEARIYYLRTSLN